MLFRGSGWWRIVGDIEVAIEEDARVEVEVTGGNGEEEEEEEEEQRV